MPRNLATKKCTPCEGGTPPLDSKRVGEYLKQLPEWQLSDDPSAGSGQVQSISRKWKFKNFVEAMIFVNRMAEIAEEEGHHPDISISYSRVTLTLWTHAIGGLSENDFIMAAKIDTVQ